MFFRKPNEAARASRPPVSTELSALVQQYMEGADLEDVRIVTAIAGLLSVVAYADRDYTPEERARIREDLARVQGMPTAGAEAICALVDRVIIELGTVNSQVYTRDLRELVDVDVRRDVLDVLVDLAASDGEISLSESDLLRRTAGALGLSQHDYNASQQRHRHSLSLLK